MSALPTVATCRGCQQVLRGLPYHTGKPAYHPVTGERCKSNHYGGHVCSEQCDRRAYLKMEQSMPGHIGQKSIDLNASRTISRKWSEA